MQSVRIGSINSTTIRQTLLHRQDFEQTKKINVFISNTLLQSESAMQQRSQKPACFGQEF